jgi:hypothetical protein
LNRSLSAKTAESPKAKHVRLHRVIRPTLRVDSPVEENVRPP